MTQNVCEKLECYPNHFIHVLISVSVTINISSTNWLMFRYKQYLTIRTLQIHRIQVRFLGMLIVGVKDPKVICILEKLRMFFLVCA